MVKRKQLTEATKYVRHRRYGAHSIPSGTAFSEAEIRGGHWSYRGKNIFPESALLADTAKQNYSMYPRHFYVDVAQLCRECGRPFLFFAREQRYWFETLGFYVDADCVHCPECRRDSQAMRRRLRRYSDLRQIEAPTRKELMFMVEDAAYLLERGALRDLNSLGNLKNQARKAIPEFEGTEALAVAIADARNQEQEPRK